MVGLGPSLNTHNLALNPIKFVCSYGGRIVPRYPDGKLRYQGGETRVLSIERSISFLELFVKMVEMCGTAVSLKCQLPGEDLDTLVSITSDEDLTNLIEEYDLASAAAETSLKIRAFLFRPKTNNKVSPPPSSASSSTSATSPRSPFESVAIPPRRPTSALSSTGATSPRSAFDSVALPQKRSNFASGRFIRQGERPPAYPVLNDKPTGKKVPGHQYAYGNFGHACLNRNGNDWQ